MNAQNLALPLFKLGDTLKRATSAATRTTVRFSHPGSPHRMRDLYVCKKDGAGLLSIEADPAGGHWREVVRVGALRLDNYYRLEVTDHTWTGVPTWRTWTTSVTRGFEIDFTDPRFTLLAHHGDRSSLDSPHFQEWFDYVKASDVDGVTIE